MGAHARVILVLHGYIWNALEVLLVLQVFNDIAYVGYLLHRVFYRPLVSTPENASHFLTRNLED